MRILLGYSWFNSQRFNIRDFWESWIERLRGYGFGVDGYCLTINPPGPCYSWSTLDGHWKNKNPTLMAKYEDLARTLENYDVFINYNGINIHPGLLPSLPTFNVFCCFDDPESSHNLSRPVASSYDLCMVGNIAEVGTYRSWGATAYHWPIGFRAEDVPPDLTKEKILTENRPNDLVLLCEKTTASRVPRLNAFKQEFPKALCYGRGWKNGYLPTEHQVPLYLISKIGPNFHLSTGPVNFRTYGLPAAGVLQICDNKKFLGELFELDKEVVGFETMEECFEKIRYYLDHEMERREIAAAGWERAHKDYNERVLFQKMIDRIEEVKNRG